MPSTNWSEEGHPGLYLIPTPIGNLGDITLRSLEVLQQVDTILAEDTRKSGILLNHYEVKKPLQSFHAFNEHKMVGKIVERILGGERMALITDAGTPGIADPGFLLVRECLKENIKVECLPGATAIVPALIKSGFPTDRFIFEGFVPHKKGKQSFLERLAEEERTTVLYESPHRLIKTLQQMLQIYGEDRQISVSRELTKMHEETITGELQDVAKHFEANPPKGEIVIVIQGKADKS